MSTSPPPFYVLSVAANIERHMLASGEPWVLLLCLQWPGAADPTATQQYIRLARNDEPVTFDAADGNGPQVYTPFNFEMGELATSSTGQVPELELKASNVMRVLQTTIEQYQGVVGANLTLYAVNTSNPNGEADLTLAFTVKQTICDAKQVTFKLGASSPLRRLFPIHMYRPNFCIWQFMGPQCAYVGTAFTGATTAGSAIVTGVGSLVGLAVGAVVGGAGVPGGTTILSATGSTVTLSANATATGSPSLTAVLGTCSHTIDGATGCDAHNNLVRIGTFPGIDTNGAAVAGVA